MLIDRYRTRLNNLLWETDLDSLPGWQRFLVRLLRILSAVMRDINGGLPTLRAMSLVYTTLLSLVPLIAVSFSVLKGFGVHNQIEPVLQQVLSPLGDKGTEITATIISFVNNIKVGVLGALGLAMLLYTVISLVKKIESAFNYTWRIKRVRSLSDSFTNYLSIIMVGPVLVFTAFGITASISHSAVVTTLSSIEPFGTLLTILGKLVPYILIIGAFTFIYKLIPNTRVKLSSAFYGAVVAGVLWETMGLLFTTFVANSANYTAVYSGFAILIVFMIWLYLSWLILLTGSTIAYYHQHPERITYRSEVLRLSCRLREKLALLVMQLVANVYHNNGKLHTLDSLGRRLSIAGDALCLVTDALEERRLLLRTGDGGDQYIPGRSIDRISVLEILQTARIAEETSHLKPDSLNSNSSVDDVVAAIETSFEGNLHDKNLLDLVDTELKA